MVVFVRIDDRLIHGQVVEGWVNFLKATGIFVADDGVASNALQRSIMEVAVPRGLKVSIGRVEDICQEARTSETLKERIILLFSNPSSMLKALKLGNPKAVAEPNAHLDRDTPRRDLYIKMWEQVKASR